MAMDPAPPRDCESNPRSPRPRECKRCSAANRRGMRALSPRQSDCAGPRRNIFPASPEKSCRKAASGRGRTARAPGCSEKRGRDKPGPWSLRNRFIPPAKRIVYANKPEFRKRPQINFRLEFGVRLMNVGKNAVILQLYVHDRPEFFRRARAD